MYRIPNKKLWQGRIDTLDGREGFRWHQAIQTLPINSPHFTPISANDAVSYVITGFCCDEGVKRNLGRIGASEAPKHIRKALANLPYHLSDKSKIIDIGDVVCLGDFLEDAQVDLGEKIDYILSKGYKSIVLGGGHEVAYGHYLGIHHFARKHQLNVGIINFDAHLDTRSYKDNATNGSVSRTGKGNSGTPFLQIAELCEKNAMPFHYLAIGIQKQSNTTKVFNNAKEIGAEYILSNRVNMHYLSELLEKLEYFVADKDALYITVCMDVFAAAFAPAVSATNGEGVYPEVVFALLDYLANTRKIIAFDIAELNPQFDRDEQTAKLAANLIFKIVP